MATAAAPEDKSLRAFYERYKTIIAIAFVVVAFALLAQMFFGSSSSSSSNSNKRKASANANTSSLAARAQANTNTTPIAKPSDVRQQQQDLAPPQMVVYTPPAPAPEAGRNIFAFYVPPPPPPRPIPTVPTPSPSPTPPPPPLILAALVPSNVYARTNDFALQVSGDKFTPAVRVVIDGREMPTRFVSAQQLTATVPASVIAYEGTRTIKVQTPDGKLFSNTATLNVMPPPAPNYTYIGIIGGPHYNDTAVLKDKNTNELVNVQRGDPVGGRYRVTGISEREVTLTDTSIGVKHRLAFSGDSSSVNTRSAMPTSPRPVQSDDDQ